LTKKYRGQDMAKAPPEVRIYSKNKELLVMTRVAIASVVTSERVGTNSNIVILDGIILLLSAASSDWCGSNFG